MIIEKLLTLIFSTSVLRDINIDLPSSAFTAVRTLFNSASALGQLIDLSSFLWWTVSLIFFEFALANFCFWFRVIRG